MSLSRDRLRQMDARTFYEAEGFRLIHASRKGWVMVKCCFHESRSKRSLSVNLSHGGFHCFGCGVSGDLIAFVRLRDRCNFKAACQRLGIWDDQPSSEGSRRECERGRREQERLKEAAEALRRQQKALRIASRDELHLNHRLSRETGEHLTKLGIESTSPSAQNCWHILSMLLPEIRKETATYTLMSFGSRADTARYTLNEGARSEMIVIAINQGGGFIRDDEGHAMEVDFT